VKRKHWSTVGMLFLSLVTNQTYAQPNNDLQSGTDYRAFRHPNAADKALIKRIRTALAQTKQLDSSTIFIGAHDGSVLLRGEVQGNDQAEKIVAVTAAVAGVRNVVNRISVRRLLE
jgi:osmotically-inducible protein OsmY